MSACAAPLRRLGPLQRRIGRRRSARVNFFSARRRFGADDGGFDESLRRLRQPGLKISDLGLQLADEDPQFSVLRLHLLDPTDHAHTNGLHNLACSVVDIPSRSTRGDLNGYPVPLLIPIHPVYTTPAGERLRAPLVEDGPIFGHS